MRDYISISQINMYMMCSLKYRFAYIDEIEPKFKPAALAFGSSFHAALEWLHRRRMNQSLTICAEDVFRIFKADWYAWKFQNVRFKDGQDHDSISEIGERMILKYIENLPEKKPMDVEVEFRIPFVNPETGDVLDMDLKGVIDLLESDDTIVEHKTSARVMDESTVNASLQLTAYSYAFRYLFDRIESGIRLDNITKSKQTRIVSFSVQRTESDYVRLFNIANAVLRGICAGIFFPTPNWMCADCEYLQGCIEWKGNSGMKQFREKEVAV